MSSNRIFVYGTLRKTPNGVFHPLLGMGAKYITEAFFKGKLYLVKDYPGVVHSDSHDGWVRGEIYEIATVGNVLPKLDLHEEYYPDAVNESEYIRSRETVIRADGTKEEAWMYIYNRDVSVLKPISSGDFMYF